MVAGTRKIFLKIIFNLIFFQLKLVTKFIFKLENFIFFSSVKFVTYKFKLKIFRQERRRWRRRKRRRKNFQKRRWINYDGWNDGRHDDENGDGENCFDSG